MNVAMNSHLKTNFREYRRTSLCIREYFLAQIKFCVSAVHPGRTESLALQNTFMSKIKVTTCFIVFFFGA